MYMYITFHWIQFDTSFRQEIHKKEIVNLLLYLKKKTSHFGQNLNII